MPEQDLTAEQLQKSKRLVLDSISDLFGDFIYYDRKEDEDLPRGRIELLVERGVLSPQAIVAEFERHVLEYFEILKPS